MARMVVETEFQSVRDDPALNNNRLDEAVGWAKGRLKELARAGWLVEEDLAAHHDEFTGVVTVRVVLNSKEGKRIV